jgi:hypothetical protein
VRKRSIVRFAVASFPCLNTRNGSDHGHMNMRAHAPCDDSIGIAYVRSGCQGPKNRARTGNCLNACLCQKRSG